MKNIFGIRPNHAHGVNISHPRPLIENLSRRRDISQLDMEMLNVTERVLTRVASNKCDAETLRLADILSGRVDRLHRRLNRRHRVSRSFADEIWTAERRASMRTARWV